MPGATSLQERLRILALHQQGLSSLEIARLLSIPASTLRGLLGQWRLQPPDSGLDPHFDCCGRSLQPGRLTVQEACCALRRQHPTWGAARIRLDLLRCHRQEMVPPTRTLQFWLKKAGLAPQPRVRRLVHKDLRRAQQPHDVWQMDAVEGLRLLDGSAACWLRLTDEYSGAILVTELFPPVLLVHG